MMKKNRAERYVELQKPVFYLEKRSHDRVFSLDMSEAGLLRLPVVF